MNMHNSKKTGNVLCGFTLIELLVVIAIISLLVSILLPSLQQARDLAKDILCKSNLKGIGTAYLLYSSDDAAGMIPAVYRWDATKGLMYWPRALQGYLGVEDDGSFQGDTAAWRESLNTMPILRCPQAEPFMGNDRTVGYGQNTYLPLGITLFQGASSTDRWAASVPLDELGEKTSVYRQFSTSTMLLNGDVVWALGLNLHGGDYLVNGTNYYDLNFIHGDEATNMLFVDMHVEAEKYSDGFEGTTEKEAVYFGYPYSL